MVSAIHRYIVKSARTGLVLGREYRRPASAKRVAISLSLGISARIEVAAIDDVGEKSQLVVGHAYRGEWVPA